MAIRVDIMNIDKVERLIRELPENLDKSFSTGNQIWMESLRDKAKIRVPVDTGSLKESIKLEPVRRGKHVKIWKLVVSSPYALFQEEGFTPHAFYANPSRGFKSTYLSSGFNFFVSKWTPFVEPALQDNLSKFDNMINKSLGRAIK